MFKSLKKQLITDGVVILLIIIGVLVFYFVTKNSTVGWEITGSTETLSNEEKEVSGNVMIYKGGNLEMENSTMTLIPSYDNQIGIFIAGDSYMSLKDSKINAEDFQFFLSTESVDGKSSEIIMDNSEISGHSGIYLQNRTKFYAVDSIVEELHIKDSIRADLTKSKLYPVLFSDQKEQYHDLYAGESITTQIDSEKGWSVDMIECEVWGYQIDIFEDNDISIFDSSDIVVSLHSPGDLDECTQIATLLTNSDPASGELSEFSAKFVWENTVIDMLNIYVQSEDDVIVEGNIVNEADVSDNGALELRNLSMHCNLCSAVDSSEMVLDNVKILGDEDTKPTMTISGNASVTILNSDIRDLKIIMVGNGSLTIKDSEYNSDHIDNVGQGSIILD